MRPPNHEERLAGPGVGAANGGGGDREVAAEADAIGEPQLRQADAIVAAWSSSSATRFRRTFFSTILVPSCTFSSTMLVPCPSCAFFFHDALFLAPVAHFFFHKSWSTRAVQQ